MDELKLLIEMVAKLPALAVWVLVGFLIYKICVVSSIYGVLRLVILKAHDAFVCPKKVDFMMNGIAIDENVAKKIRHQISRLTTSSYLHEHHIAHLEEAIDEVLKKRKIPGVHVN